MNWFRRKRKPEPNPLNASGHVWNDLYLPVRSAEGESALAREIDALRRRCAEMEARVGLWRVRNACPLGKEAT